MHFCCNTRKVAIYAFELKLSKNWAFPFANFWIILFIVLGVKKQAFYGHPEQKGEVTPPSLTISICENVALFPFRYDSVMLKTYFISL